MIVFDQLRISNEGDKLFINFHVNFAEYYDDVMLDSVIVTTADKILESNPTSLPQEFIYKKTYSEDLQVDNIVLDKAALDAAFNNRNSSGEPIDSTKPYATIPFDKSTFNEDLFFVYVKCKVGVISGTVPCEADNPVTLGIAFNDKTIYQKTMQYTKEIADTCNIPGEFIDFILLWNAFKVSVDTGHYNSAISFWNLLLDKKTGSPTININKRCGCHG